MKQHLFRPFLLLALLAGWGARAQTLLQSQSFENGETVNYTATSLPQDNTTTCPGNAYCNTSAGTAQRYNQYFQRVNESTSPYTLPTSPSNVWPLQPTTGAGLDGTYFWAAEGTRGGQSITARPPAVLRLNSISTVAGKSNLQVKVALLAGRASLQPYNSTNDSIRVQVRLNGGSTWTTIGEFTGDASGNMRQTKGNSSNPATLTEQMTDFTFDVGSSANSLETRIVIANRTSEELAFDNIRVFGTAANGAPPVVDNVETTSLNYAEGQAATPITQSITVSDTDSPTLNSGTVQFTSGFVSTEDQLVFASQLGITGSYNPTTGVLTLTGSASPANYQAALRAVSYQNTNTITAKAGDRIVSFAVTDPTNLTSSPDTRTIAVTTALDAASGLPYTEDLETNGEGTRYASNNTTATLTNGRAFLRTSVASEPGGQWHTNGSAATTISGINNSNYWWASGTDALSGGVGTFITKQVNTAGYTNLNFSVKLAASNNVWENVQYLKVYYRLGGSSGTWIPLLSFRSTDQTSTVNQASTTGNLRQDANPATTTGVPTGAQLTPTLTTYSATLPTSANGQLVDFKIDALSKFADGVGEVIAFDNLQLTGTATTTVNSIVRASTNPTNAATVNYTVTFGAPVTGLTASNFSLTTTGNVSGASVGTPVASTGNTTWTVPVNTGTGSGTLTLNLANDTNLSADITTTLPFAGETYTIDKTAPAAPVVTAPANGSSLATTTPTYTGTSEANATVTVIIDGSSIGTTTASGSGNWTLTQPTALAQGSHTVRATATDAVGNISPSSSTNNFTVDTTRPSVTISSTAGASGSTTATSPIPFTVTFSENVTGFVAGDVTVSGGTIVTSSFSGSGSIYTFNVTPTGSTVTVSVPANVAQDQAGNNNTAAGSFSLTYQQPLVVSSQNVTVNLDANGNGTLSASSVNNNSSGSGTLTYTIQKIVYGRVGETPSPALTLATPNGANFTTIRFASYGTPNDNGNGNYSLGSCNAANSLAAARNAYVGRSSGTMYASNTDARNNPVLGDPCGGTPKALAVQAAYSADAASLTYDCTEAGKTQYVLLTVTNGTSTNTSVAQVTVNPPATATLSSINPSPAPAGATVTVNGTNLSGVTSVTLNGTPLTTSNVSATSFQVTLPSTATSGPLTVSLPCSQTLTTTLTVTQPTVTAVTGQTPSPTATSTVRYQVTFSGSVTGLTTNNFTLTTSGSVSGASVASVSGSGTTYTVLVNTGTGDGSLRLDVSNSTGTTPIISNVPYTSGTTYTITKSFAAAPTLRIQAAGSASNNGDVTAFVDVVQVLNASNGSAVANGLQNGSFENNNVDPNGYKKTGDGVVAAPWSFTGLAGISRNGSGFGSTAADGGAVALIQSAGDNNASVSQNLAVPTGSYQVTFQTAQRYYTSVDQQLNVFVNNVFVGNIQPNQGNPPPYVTFTSATFSVTAPTLTATVSTTSASPTSTAPIPFSVSFSQSVGTSFTAADVTVAGGTLTSGSFSGSGAGPYTFTVTPSGSSTVSVSVAADVANDANNTSNSTSNTLSVQFQAPTIVVGPASLPNGTQGTAYSQALSASGGTAPYSYAITAGALPAGLSLNLGNGTIAGTPTTNGTFTFTVTATDASAAPGPYSGSRSYSLTISTQPVTAAPVVTAPANGSLTNSTTPTYQGTAPAGNLVTVYVDGASIGTTTTSAGGSFSLSQPTALDQGSHTVYATAQTSGSAVSPNSNTNTFTVDSVRPSVAISSSAGTNGGSTPTSPIPFTVAFSENVTGFVAGDVSVTGGALSGFTAVSGTTYTFSVTPSTRTSTVTVNIAANVAVDQANNGNTAASQYSLTFVAPTIVVSPTTLPAGTVGVAYSQTLTAAGGTAPYSYAITAGALPAGLTLSAAGVISGTPTGGTSTFTVTATDASAAPGPYSGSLSYTLTIAAPTITVAPASLPDGTQSTAYSQTFTTSGGTSPYTYAITAGALPAGLTLSAAGVLSGTPTVNGSFTFTVTATDASTGAGPYSGSRSYTLTIAAPAVTAVTWTGTISTDWFTAGNWSPNRVPSATLDATIPTTPSGGRFPALSAGTANVRNLTLNSGSALNQSGGTLVIAASLTNNGTFQPIDGTVLLGNSTLSSILGSSNTRFWNLTVGANGAQQSTSATTSVQRVLTLNGNFAINGNPFTLESNANGTAMVVNNGSSVLSGNVTVQRYISPDLNPNLGYRHFSSPISNATVNSLTTAGFKPVVNDAYNTSAQPGTVKPFPTVYGYDQSRLATTTNNLPTFDKGWFSPGALSSALNVGQGYTVNLAANQTFSLTGPQNNGNVALNLARNTGATAADAGLALVGNPYPSPLDWSQVASTDRPGLDGVIYVFASNDPTNPYLGSYSFYNNGIGTISPVLPLGQGFFVRVNNDQNSATLTFKNSHRPTTYSNNAYRRTAAESRPLVQLTLKGTGSAVSDDAFVYFEQGSTEGFDSQYDALKLPNPNGLNLSASVAGKQFSIDGLPELGSVQRVVPLAVGVPAAGVYSLASAQLLNLDATPVYLRDLQAGTLTDLRLTPSYQFTVTNASALITGRFELVFSPQKALATVPAALAQQVGLYPNPAKTAAFVELPASLGRQAVTATLVDALGRVARTVLLPAQGALAHQLDLHELPTGIYALRLSTSAGVVVKRLTVE